MSRLPIMKIGREWLVLTGLLVVASDRAWAADWYTGAATPKSSEDWIVSLDASTTVTTTSSAFVNVGGTAAIAGTLADSGARVRVEGLAGTYEYRAPDGSRVRGDQVEASAMAGYEWIWREAKLAGYVGLSLRNTALSINDPGNPVVGLSFGLKTAVDFNMRPSENTMVSAYGSFSTNDKAYFTRFKAGYRIAGDAYFGPEIGFLGNDFYNQWRAGVHLTGMSLGPLQASLAAGYQYDREQKGGAYGSVDVRAQF